MLSVSPYGACWWWSSIEVKKKKTCCRKIRKTQRTSSLPNRKENTLIGKNLSQPQIHTHTRTHTVEQRDCGVATLHCSQSANEDHGNTGGSVICGCRHYSGHKMDRSDIHGPTGWGCVSVGGSVCGNEVVGGGEEWEMNEQSKKKRKNQDSANHIGRPAVL